MLTVSGERKLETEERKENFRRVERQYGSFSRSFSLPASADTDNISTNFENGTLRVDIAKRARSVKRRSEARKLRRSPQGRLPSEPAPSRYGPDLICRFNNDARCQWDRGMHGGPVMI